VEKNGILNPPKKQLARLAEMDPARDARIAYAHLMRAKEHRRAGAFGKAERHQRRAEWYARRVAFGSATEPPVGPERAETAAETPIVGLGIPNIGRTCYMGTALQCLFVTTFEVSAKYAELRDAYNELKAACSGETAQEDTYELATNVYYAVRDAFRSMGGVARDLEEEMALKEIDINGDIRRLSNKIEVGAFLKSLLACGCDDAECPYEMLYSYDKEIENTEPAPNVGASVLCISWGAYHEAPERITVGGANYELVAMAVHTRNHHIAYTKRFGKWAVYDDVEVRALGEAKSDSGKLEHAKKSAEVYFYQKAGAAADT
jgi:hypothetical protein